MPTKATFKFLPLLLLLVPLLSVTLAAAAGAASPDDIPLAPAVECSPRAGLPNFFAKLAAGEEVRIAYLGGSITAQEGWRPKTLAYFQKAFPKAKLSQINAAIGGTGSDLGVFRLEQDVLDHKPDLLFVEFAVNDGGARPRRSTAPWRASSARPGRPLPTAISATSTRWSREWPPRSRRASSPAPPARWRRSPIITASPASTWGWRSARMARSGKLIFKGPLPKTDEEKKAAGDKIVFSPEGVHPYPETGHELYLQAIVRSLPAIRAESKKPGPHRLGTPFTPDNYQQAQIVPIDKAVLSPGFQRLGPQSE